MSWLKRLFGLEKPENAQINPTPQISQTTATATETIPPERLGLNGEYDQSGLAKRVTLAYDEDPQLDDVNTLWVAQTGSTVVLRGKVPNQNILNKMISVANSVHGTTSVDTSEVKIG
ncbi:phospholipid-binding protein [Sphaerospermopsis aphanizomenoides BCCUSP55]|uniref:phospholipid-binding protein n=1 Tax=Sphaerospermopsis aphanizomenoides TaxID=459663 RepID=UPI000A8AACFB|nr:phospholipid-binding protein [Sphaerospermopsis aphanizomenoides]MBK1986995.1 phospholipid-binding protein [Sphaerospermopsis aphanizomenoides BCCUSP55]